VEDSLKNSILDLHFKLTKVGSSYRIWFSNTSEEKPGPPQIYCFDGTDFHFYSRRRGKLQLGDNLVKKHQLINGALQYFPPFVLPWAEAVYDPEIQDDDAKTKIFITPEKLYKIVITIEGLQSVLTADGYTLKIPKIIRKVNKYGEGFGKTAQGFSYVVESGTFALLQKGEVSPEFFKISDAEVKQLAASIPSDRKARVFTFPIEKTLEAALQKSRSGGLPLFIMYGREACGNCEVLKEMIEKKDLNLNDPAFVIADINCDDEQEGPKFKKAYKIEGKALPFVVIASPTGELIESRTGTGELIDYRKFVSNALDHIKSQKGE
jgi:hypothetical protein